MAYTWLTKLSGALLLAAFGIDYTADDQQVRFARNGGDHLPNTQGGQGGVAQALCRLHSCHYNKQHNNDPKCHLAHGM